MSRSEKLLTRLLSTPKDFTWEEQMKVLMYLKYEQVTTGKTGGSRREFVDSSKNIVILHKPHPGNILKAYALRQVIDHLKEKGKIHHE